MVLSLLGWHPISWVLAILVPILLLRSWRSSKPRLPLPPGTMGWPLLGETVQLVLAMRQNEGYGRWFRSKAARHGPFFKTHIMGSPLVVMDPPQGNRFLFQNEEVLLEHDYLRGTARLFGRDSLYAKVGKEHELARRPFSSFLDRQAVLGYLQGVERNAIRHFDRHWEGKGELAAHHTTKLFTFATICYMLFSLEEVPGFERLESLFATWLDGAFSPEVNLPGFKFHYALKAREAILQILDVHIAQRRRDLSGGRLSEAAKGDVLTALLTFSSESGASVSDAEIKDNLLFLLSAGHDTSSIALTMIILMVGKNQHVYDQLVEGENVLGALTEMECAEHKAILQRKRAEGEGDELTREDLASMKYSWRVIQETLRMHPPVAGAFRTAIKDIEYNGYTIPKGWKVMWNNQLSHCNGEFFREPLKFDPARWEEGEPEPFTYLPFGGGQRVCPGYEFAKMEMLVYLHHLLKRYRWTLTDPDEPIIRNPIPRTPKDVPIRIAAIPE